VAPPLLKAIFQPAKKGYARGFVVAGWTTGAGGIGSQNLQAMGGALFLPLTTAALAAAIFAVDTLQIWKSQFPSFTPQLSSSQLTFVKRAALYLSA
jgi:hypothetical protein